MRDLLLRILLVTPWIFLIWFIAQGFNGSLDGLLVFVLTIVFVPLFIGINFITVVLVRGQAVMSRIRNAQQQQRRGKKPLESENYAELPWWNPRRWL